MFRYLLLLIGIVGLLACAGLPMDQLGGSAASAAPVAGAPTDAEMAALDEAPSPWNCALVTSMIALMIGGISAILGIWVGRDSSRPIVFALAMTTLIGAAIFVGILQSYLDSDEAVRRQQDLDRMVAMVEELAAKSGDPELASLAAEHGGKRGKRK